MDYVTTTQESTAMSPLVLVFYIAFIVFEIIVLWKIFAKAGQPGWAAIVPIYNFVVLFKIIKMDWWHILILLFVPGASIVYGILIPLKLAKAFGKSTAFAVLSIFFSTITFPILAFGSAKYEG